MASATRKPVEPVETNIHLVMTEAEAQTLLQVCSRIGGRPDDTPRGHMDSIAEVLRSLGVVQGDFPIEQFNDSIYFVNPNTRTF